MGSKIYRFLSPSNVTALAVGLLALAAVNVAPAQSQQQTRPNIIVIMGDDIGWFNFGAYHRGIMAGRTPNIDKIAKEGAMFTDYYAEAACTAGRANFITGQLALRAGLTTVGQAGQPIGMPSRSPTFATALKNLGYATGQFAKNHSNNLTTDSTHRFGPGWLPAPIGFGWCPSNGQTSLAVRFSGRPEATGGKT